MRVFRWLFLLVLVIGGTGAAWAWNEYRSYIGETRTIPVDAQTFVVQRGWSARRVASELAAKGIIDKPRVFEFYAKRSQLAPKIKSGEFILPATATVPELLDVLVAGKTVQYKHSIIEGHNWRQVRAQLAQSPDLVQSIASLDDAEIMAKLGLEGQHPEGLFFADTYAFPRNSSRRVG